MVINGGKGETCKSRDEAFVHPSVPGTEAKSPWNDYGYKKLTQFHLRYYYIFEEAIEKVLKGELNWEEAIRDNSGIVEVWFKSDGGLYRLDRYIEKLDAKCKSYEGKPPDTLLYNDETYSLYERVFQKENQFVSYTFRSGTQIDYDDKTKQAIAQSCRYEKFTSDNEEPMKQGSAISRMMWGHTSGTAFGFYFKQEVGDEDIDMGLDDLGALMLEDMKLTDPAKYKQIIEGWKTEKDIAGRKTVKDFSSPLPFKGGIGIEGYQFIDLEFGMGLEGYLTGCHKSWMYEETKFKEPKLVYKTLLIETVVSSDVFEIF